MTTAPESELTLRRTRRGATGVRQRSRFTPKMCCVVALAVLVMPHLWNLIMCTTPRSFFTSPMSLRPGTGMIQTNIVGYDVVWESRKAAVYFAHASPIVHQRKLLAPTNSPAPSVSILTSVPSTQPSPQPSSQPTNDLSATPSAEPTTTLSLMPSSLPSVSPSANPSDQPSALPSVAPTISASPTSTPSHRPSDSLSPSSNPTSRPSTSPSNQPTSNPSVYPSASPSDYPSNRPSASPSREPTSNPSSSPSANPTTIPTMVPSYNPSITPSTSPTSSPSSFPSTHPTEAPSMVPSLFPSSKPSSSPTGSPSSSPSVGPTVMPSMMPSPSPSSAPSTFPSGTPSSSPSAKPTAMPSLMPSMPPSSAPSAHPSSNPTDRHSSSPSDQPTSSPSNSPSASPSWQPSATPSSQPTEAPSALPTMYPTSQPSVFPSAQPTSEPSSSPSDKPSVAPSIEPTDSPSISLLPTLKPSAFPTAIVPSAAPSSTPSMTPSSSPSQHPTNIPSASIVPTNALKKSALLDFMLPYDEVLKNESIATFEETLEDFLQEELSKSSEGTEFKYFNVTVVSQQVVASDEELDGEELSNAEPETVRRRSLEEMSLIIRVLIDAIVSSPVNSPAEIDFQEVVENAVTQDSARFFGELFATDAFEKLNPIEQSEESINTLRPNDEEDNNTAAIASTASVVVLGSIALLFFVVRRRRGAESDYIVQKDETPSIVVDAPPLDYANYDDDDVVSSLGDEMIADADRDSEAEIDGSDKWSLDHAFPLQRSEGLGMPHYELTDSDEDVPEDEDWKDAGAFATDENLCEDNRSPSSRILESFEEKLPVNDEIVAEPATKTQSDQPKSLMRSMLKFSCFSDNTFNEHEEQVSVKRSSLGSNSRLYEVRVGPGPLGIIVDNSPSGGTIIAEVKATSPLKHMVNVGDKIVMLDDVDTSMKSAVALGQWIMKKPYKEEQVLIVLAKEESDVDVCDDIMEDMSV